jgi:hypothetical protein
MSLQCRPSPLRVGDEVTAIYGAGQRHPVATRCAAVCHLAMKKAIQTPTQYVNVNHWRGLLSRAAETRQEFGRGFRGYQIVYILQHLMKCVDMHPCRPAPVVGDLDNLDATELAFLRGVLALPVLRHKTTTLEQPLDNIAPPLDPSAAITEPGLHLRSILSNMYRLMDGMMSSNI